MARALAGLRRYQEAPRRPRPEPMPAIAEAHGAVLRDYGGAGPPLLFIPSLINPPDVLDLTEGRSLLRWLAGRGERRVMLLDWSDDAAARHAMSVAGHVSEIIVPLMTELGEPPALAGYCLGGTMALAAAALAPAEQVVTIAAPWHFGGYAQEARDSLTNLWRQAEPLARQLGVLPMEAMQSAFWSLDPARTVAKFEALADMAPGSAEADAFVTLEDWANDGPPIPAAAARELFEDFIGGNLPGRGTWQVGGMVIDPARLPCPGLAIVSTSDRIVPSATAPASDERIDLAQGHVGMVVGSRAREALWEPLAAWLSQRGAG